MRVNILFTWNWERSEEVYGMWYVWDIDKKIKECLPWQTTCGDVLKIFPSFCLVLHIFHSVLPIFPHCICSTNAMPMWQTNQKRWWYYSLSINLQCECQRGVGQQSEVWGNLHFVCWRIQSVDGTVALCWGGGGQTVHQTEISSIKSTSAWQVKIQY